MIEREHRSGEHPAGHFNRHADSLKARPEAAFNRHAAVGAREAADLRIGKGKRDRAQIVWHYANVAVGEEDCLVLCCFDEQRHGEGLGILPERLAGGQEARWNGWESPSYFLSTDDSWIGERSCAEDEFKVGMGKGEEAFEILLKSPLLAVKGLEDAYRRCVAA